MEVWNKWVFEYRLFEQPEASTRETDQMKKYCANVLKMNFTWTFNVQYFKIILELKSKLLLNLICLLPYLEWGMRWGFVPYGFVAALNQNDIGFIIYRFIVNDCW